MLVIINDLANDPWFTIAAGIASILGIVIWILEKAIKDDSKFGGFLKRITHKKNPIILTIAIALVVFVISVINSKSGFSEQENEFNSKKEELNAHIDSLNKQLNNCKRNDSLTIIELKKCDSNLNGQIDKCDNLSKKCDALKSDTASFQRKINSLNALLSTKNFRSISGKVSDNDTNTPIENAKIYISEINSNNYDTTLFSNKNGEFFLWLGNSFNGPRAYVIISKETYIPQRRIAVIEYQNKSPLDIRLSKI